jgi:uncharacterized protein (DUF952 family)
MKSRTKGNTPKNTEAPQPSAPPKEAYIFHIVTPENWAKWEGKLIYEDPSLKAEGFIHCSYKSQIEGVLSRYFKGIPIVNILKIDTTKLTPPLKDELAPIGEMFPHIFGPINQSCIVEIDEWNQ